MGANDYGIIAFLDVLGTKEMGRKSAEEISEFMDKFDSLVEEAKKITTETIRDKDRPDLAAVNYECLAFSDTIIVVGKYNASIKSQFDAINLQLAAFICAMIMKKAFEDSIYLRGGISIGEFHKRENAIIGKAVSEVADYYDKPQWIGISLSPSAYYAFSEMEELQSSTILVPYDLPLRDNGVEPKALSVNWPVFMSNEYRKANDKTSMKRHYETIKKKCADPNLTNAFKWRNTKAFFEAHSSILME